jgi:putative oxidoreductase
MEAYVPAPLKFLHKPDLGILLLRVGIGIVGIFHGSQKLFGIWEGHGISGFAGYLEKLNVPLPVLNAWLAALAEFGGGILILLGFMIRPVAIPFAITMIVAWVLGHNASFLKENGGSDFPFMLALASLALIFTGPGKYSLQALLMKKPARTT